MYFVARTCANASVVRHLFRRSERTKHIIMKRLIYIVVIMLAVACSSSRKSGGISDAVTVDNESFQLKNDTLYSSTGLSFDSRKVFDHKRNRSLERKQTTLLPGFPGF